MDRFEFKENGFASPRLILNKILFDDISLKENLNCRQSYIILFSDVFLDILENNFDQIKEIQDKYNK